VETAVESDHVMRDALAHADSRRVRLLALLGIAAAILLVRAEASQAAFPISSSAAAAERSGANESTASRSCSSAVGPCFFLAVRAIGGGRIQSSQGYSGERLLCPPQDGWACVLPLAINDAWFNWPFGPDIVPQITLTAIATTGGFTGWTDCPRLPSGPGGTQCVVAHSDLEVLNYQVCVTANFTPPGGDTGACSEATEPPIGDPVNVTKTGTGQGYVTSSPAGINCGNVPSGTPVCSRVFQQTTTVTLNAHTAAGSKWAGWSGFPCSGTQTATTCQFTMPFGNESNPPPRVNITGTFNAVTPPPPPPPPAVLNAVILSKPAKTTRSRTARFAWGAKRDGTFKNPFSSQCRLDGQIWKACSPAKTYRNLRAGRLHTFRVRVRDGLNPKWDPTPAVWTWRIRR
jgi:Divergent InlB B-repeat domain